MKTRVPRILDFDEDFGPVMAADKDSLPVPKEDEGLEGTGNTWAEKLIEILCMYK